jgi:hypothetical protein
MCIGAEHLDQLVFLDETAVNVKTSYCSNGHSAKENKPTRPPEQHVLAYFEQKALQPNYH